MAKTMKKLLSLAIALIMVLSLIPAVSAEKQTIITNGGTEYTSNEAGWFEISTASQINKWLHSATSSDYILGSATEPVTAKLILKADINMTIAGYIGAKTASPAHNIIIDLNGNTITAKNAARAFTIYNGNVTLLNGTIKGSGTTATGGLLYVNNGTLTLRNVKVLRENETAVTTDGGSVLYATSSTVVIDNSTIKGNSNLVAKEAGVALFNKSNGFMYGDSLIADGQVLQTEVTEDGETTELYATGGNLCLENNASFTMNIFTCHS